MKRSLVPLVIFAAALPAALVPCAHARPRLPDPATMTPYVVGLYVKGPEWTAERTPRTDSIQAGHLANMGVMAKAGALIGAGPFAGNSKFRGILLFRDLPMDSVRAMVIQDPALKTERLLIELHRWYGPKGIGEAYAERAKRRPDHPDSMIQVSLALLARAVQPPKLDSLAIVNATYGHMGHTLDMLLDGRLLASGPFFDDGPIRGMHFFAGDTTTARTLCQADPAVQAGRLNFVVLPLWTAWGVLPPKPTVKELAK